MRLVVGASLSPIKGGIEARCSELKICGHGMERVQAVESLKRSVAAWCVGLQRAGLLEQAIAERGLVSEESDASIEVEVETLDG